MGRGPASSFRPSLGFLEGIGSYSFPPSQILFGGSPHHPHPKTEVLMPQSCCCTSNIKSCLATGGRGKVGDFTEHWALQVSRSRRQIPERSFLEALCQEIQAPTGDIPTRAPDHIPGAWGGLHGWPLPGCLHYRASRCWDGLRGGMLSTVRVSRTDLPQVRPAS